MVLRVALAGAGAFGLKHLQALERIREVEIAAIADSDPGKAGSAAARFGVRQVSSSLEGVLTDRSIDAVILSTPTPLHATQAVACLSAGKHVLIEIPLADNWDGARSVLEAQRLSGKVAMCGHTRRFNPSHQWVHNRIKSGSFRLLHLDVQTLFLRRSNLNLEGEARTWTDHLLWHHAAHTVDLFAWQCGAPITRAHAIRGPAHPSMGIAMDMSIQMQTASGALCTLALSFNNDGPQGSFFRYIGDTNTYLARYDDLFDGHGQQIAVSEEFASSDGIELQDREFVAAILEGRDVEASVKDVLPCYFELHELERQLVGSTADAPAERTS